MRPEFTVSCPVCGQVAKYSARVRRDHVIANVYADGRWDRVEPYHPECYEGAGEPCGTHRVTDSRLS